MGHSFRQGKLCGVFAYGIFLSFVVVAKIWWIETKNHRPQYLSTLFAQRNKFVSFVDSDESSDYFMS